uniref:Uncharacterized protein n=1 Tax=Oncorhynchus mykiss TaxID=8022 RepID=A0A8K9V879_ONCMY
MYCYNWLQFFPLPLLANDGHFILTWACDNTAKVMSPDGQLIATSGEGVSPIKREWHSMVPSISMVIPNCHPIQIDHKILAFSRLTDDGEKMLSPTTLSVS